MPKSKTRRGGRVPQVMRFRGYRWSGVPAETYKIGSQQGNWANVTRHVLIAGSRGAPVKFDVRYFEIAPGGYSSREWHQHAHVITAIRGHGSVRIGRRWVRLGYLDTCYIAPGKVHQLRSDGDEPFGFFCIVDAKRDRARPLPPRRTWKKTGDPD